ncbi:hypothetical protein SDJN02_10777, partial [Cucurbita argyrosperma subsp. argyrosperma]
MDLACGAMYLSSCLPFFIEAFHQTPCESFLLTVVCHFLPTLHLCVCCAANYSDKRVHPSAIESSNRSSSGHPQVTLRSPSGHPQMESKVPCHCDSEFWEALGTMGDELVPPDILSGEPWHHVIAHDLRGYGDLKSPPSPHSHTELGASGTLAGIKNWGPDNKEIGFESARTKEYVEGDVFKSLVPALEVIILEATISSNRRELSKTSVNFFLYKCLCT